MIRVIDIIMSDVGNVSMADTFKLLEHYKSALYNDFYTLYWSVQDAPLTDGCRVLPLKMDGWYFVIGGNRLGITRFAKVAVVWMNVS